jgi:hypothetical protein
MSTFVFRLIAPRPNFALDLTDEEREIIGRHAAHWQPLREFAADARENARRVRASAVISPVAGDGR